MHPISTPHRPRALLLNALLTGLIACTAPAIQAAPLTETDSLRMGLTRSEFTDLNQARIQQAQAEADETRLWPNPTLELGREKTGPSRETAWKLSQPLDVSGRRGLKQTAADQRLTATESETEGQRLQRSAEIRRAFYQLLQSQENVQAIRHWARRFDHIGGIVAQLTRAGEASGYDQRRLSRERQAALAKQHEAEAELERQRAQLEALLGQAVSDGVSGQLRPETPPALNELEQGLNQHPTLLALQARSEATRAEQHASQRLFPELTLSIGGKQNQEPGQKQNGTLFSVSLPLPIFNRQQASQRHAAAQVLSAEAEYRLARQQHLAELRGLHRQTSQLTTSAERYRREAVTPSAELTRIAEAAYRAGESSVLELLDAYKGALEAHLTALELEGKARQARIELEERAGANSGSGSGFNSNPKPAIEPTIGHLEKSVTPAKAGIHAFDLTDPPLSRG